jgi:hypothetical protein
MPTNLRPPSHGYSAVLATGSLAYTPGQICLSLQGSLPSFEDLDAPPFLATCHSPQPLGFALPIRSS